MKYKDKYPDAKAGEVLRDDSLIVSKEEKSCMRCGESTRFVEYLTEGHVCSEECVDDFYAQYNDSVNKMMSAEGGAEL